MAMNVGTIFYGGCGTMICTKNDEVDAIMRECPTCVSIHEFIKTDYEAEIAGGSEE